MLDVNTVSKYPTNFLRGVELVKLAREKYNVPSENWPAPTKHMFGMPNDNYYSEVWIDGMDWQPSYWILEEISIEKPKIRPFIIFPSNEERFKFNERDFDELISAAFWYRRDTVWINHKDLGIYTDFSWPYLHIAKTSKWSKYPEMVEVYFKHASQQRVDFFMNQLFFPKYILERKEDEGDRSDRNPTPGHRNSI